MSRFDASLLQRALSAAGVTPPKAPEPLSRETFQQVAVEVTIELCKRFEGFHSHPYLCPRGIPTIGYGATYYLDGRRVTLKDPPISKEAGLRLLQRMVETVYLPAVMKLCPDIDNPKRLAAIVDWTFNLGEANLRNSTLRRRVNEGRWDLAVTEIMRWVYAGGVFYRGLQLRRRAEADLI